jgi:hypothetical protein
VPAKQITVEFCGFWPSQNDGKRVTCWNLTDDLFPHVAGSSVSSLTLEKFGFFVPEQSEEGGFEIGKFYELER